MGVLKRKLVRMGFSAEKVGAQSSDSLACYAIIVLNYPASLYFGHLFRLQTHLLPSSSISKCSDLFQGRPPRAEPANTAQTFRRSVYNKQWKNSESC